MSYYSEVLNKIQNYTESLFNQSEADFLLYHNLAHTKFVVAKTEEISANYPLDETDVFIVSAGAWFHDTGHLNGGLQLHEDRSVEIMKKFFITTDIASTVVDKIESCICKTKFPQKPKSLLQEILCDADTYNLGTTEFTTTDRLLKEELQRRNVATDNWTEKTLQLLLTHKYFTPYCINKLSRGKEINIKLLENQLQTQK